MPKKALIVAALAALALAAAAFALRGKVDAALYEAARPELPAAEPYVPPDLGPEPDAVETSVVSTLTPTETSPPPAPASEPAIPSNVKSQMSNAGEAVNLAVPFTPQAPHADWSLPFQEACEEASLYMVVERLKGRTPGLIPPDEAERELLRIVAWQEERFGYYEDTTAEETAVIARELYGYAGTEVLPVRSIDDIRREIEKGRAVIVPAAGRKLGNIYFSGQGPLYHMLVVKGFLSDGRVITNDPGTRRGADYLYDPKVFFEAIGDWNGGDPASGEKLMIVVKP